MENLECFRVKHLHSCVSTNSEIKQAIDEGEHEGFVVRADFQTGGYGRRGHKWKSPVGGLYFSCLLRPKCLEDFLQGKSLEQLPTIGLSVGVAVRRAIARMVGENSHAKVKLKWPNDVIVVDGHIDSLDSQTPSFRKICGISQEVHNGAVCVGVGINVFPSVDEASKDGELQKDKRNSIVCVADLVSPEEKISIDNVFTEVLKELSHVYQCWNELGFGCLQNEYQDQMALLGVRVCLVDDGASLGEGIVVGIDETGSILLKDEESAIVTAFLNGHVVVTS